MGIGVNKMKNDFSLTEKELRYYDVMNKLNELGKDIQKLSFADHDNAVTFALFNEQLYLMYSHLDTLLRIRRKQ